MFFHFDSSCFRDFFAHAHTGGSGEIHHSTPAEDRRFWMELTIVATLVVMLAQWLAEL
jgi:hypothetical protein